MAILFVCCCIPCSIVGLIKIVVAQSEYHHGDKAKSQKRQQSGVFCSLLAAFIGTCAALFVTFIMVAQYHESASETISKVHCNLIALFNSESKLCQAQKHIGTTKIAPTMSTKRSYITTTQTSRGTTHITGAVG